MAYEVNFAGIDLHNYCTILNIERSVLPSRENFSKEIPTMNGSHYTGYHYGERMISLEVYIKAMTKTEYVEKIRKLADALHTECPSKLITSDEPDKYYYAVVDGSTDLEKTIFSGTLTINFICHDPIAYSDKWKTFEPATSSIIPIENNGSAKTNMNVTVEFNNDACFFQMTNHKGETVLIGRPKVETNSSKKVATTVVKDKCETTDNITSLSSTLLDNDRLVTGNYSVGNNGTGIYCNNYGTSEDSKWTGAAFRRSLGKNLDQFEVAVDFVFSSKGENYKPSSSTDSSGSTSYGTYQVTPKSGLVIRKSTSTSSTRLAAMPYGTKINVTEISGKWAKHTTKVGTKTYTGYSHMDYLKKVSTSKTRAIDYADDELGILEVYGFDQNGTKLFKGMIDDANQYYEYVKPRFYIGSSKVLADDAAAPTPRKVTTKDDNGKVIKTESAVSGVYGKWNDLVGKMIIRRTKNNKGVYLWTITLNRYKDGKIVQTMSTANSISSSNYPKGELNYLGFYIGRYGSFDPVDMITVQHIRVQDLSPQVREDDNQEIFENGDVLNIDFESGLVTLNKREFLKYINIGTEFFDTPTGKSQVIYKTDDKQADVTVGIQERFL